MPSADGPVQLTGHRPPARQTVGVVLILHGGGERGHHAVRPWSGPVLRMIPFAWAIRRRAKALRPDLGGDFAVLRLRNTVYGWNGDDASPLRDARRALEELATAYPGQPVTLVGHSMGGRVALRLAADPRVTAIAALAPWIPEGEGVLGSPEQRFLLMHGHLDRVTDPRRTKAYAARLIERGVRAQWRPVPGEGHAMLRSARTWHREVAEFVVPQRDNPAKVTCE
jgi:pimeloyl-ACP methyl ester carboxylesterase